MNAEPVAMAPAELIDWACGRGRWAPQHNKSKPSDPGSVWSNINDLFTHPHANYPRAAFDRELDALANCEEGSRNDKILKTASALASFIPHRLLTESEIRNAIGWPARIGSMLRPACRRRR